MVRAQVGRLALRALPVVALGLVGLILALVLAAPGRGRPSPSRPGLSVAGTESASGASDSALAAPTGGVGRATTPTSGLVAGEPAGASGGTGSGGAVGTTAGTSGSDTSRGGVRCATGARQVAWSRYAPSCVPAFGGANGGSTSHGVTAGTVTVTYRLANSSQQAAINSIGGGAVPQDGAYIQDLNTYARLFNKQFETYGRTVKIVPYQGQGDYVSEDSGQDLAGAQADAASAFDLGAFADETFPITASQPYEEDLAAKKLIGLSGVGLPQLWYVKFAPYEYAYSPDGTKFADWEVNLVCSRLAGMPAIFGGAGVSGHTRVFGLISPENPVYVEDANAVASGIQARCGVKPAKRVSYAIDVTQFEAQASSIDAQMKTAGVTTVICLCDPLMPIFLTNSADSQQWFPEWNPPDYFDPDGRLQSADQWVHTIAFGGGSLPRDQTEAYRSFQLADPGGSPAEEYYFIAYYCLLQLFSAIQAAGPDLTPQSFERGFFSLPPSLPGGDAGDWRYGPGNFTPESDSTIGHWDPNAISNEDGKKGAWESCNNNTFYSFTDPSSWAPAHTQLHC
jgi:hypothetical protein